MNQDLAVACSANLAAAFAALIPHSGHPSGERRRFGTVEAIATGMQSAFFNPVMVVGDNVSPGDVQRAADWVRDLGLPMSAQVREDLASPVDTTLRELGLAPHEWLTPGMALASVPPMIPAPTELRIEAVTADTFHDWHLGIGYGANFQRLWRVSMVNDPAFSFVVGYVDDQPVTGAATILGAGVAGIYAVGTVESARRRGYGTAVTWAAIGAGVRSGARTATLQSSEEGLSAYEAMGFRTVCRYMEYLPAPENS